MKRGNKGCEQPVRGVPADGSGLGSASVFHHRTAEDPVDPVGSGYSFPLPRAANQESQWTLTYWFVLGWQAPSPVSVVSSLRLRRAPQASLQGCCARGAAARSHHLADITGRCSCIAALHNGARCPESHLLLICHLRTACCPGRAGSRHRQTEASAFGSRRAARPPADLPAPSARSAQGN